MASEEEYIINYHHGGTLAKKDIKYDNGTISRFSVDPDKLCHWDMLGDVKELGYDIINKDVKLFYVDSEGVLNEICDDDTIVGFTKLLVATKMMDVYVESLDVDPHWTLPNALVDECDNDDSESQSSEDDEELHVEVPILDCNSNDDDDDDDDEREEARDKLRKYVQLKKTIKGHDAQENNRGEIGGEGTSTGGCDNNTQLRKRAASSGKVTGNESDYMDSSDPGSYESTSDDSDADDAKRHKSKTLYYQPNIPLEDFFVGLRFQTLKQFKDVLVELSTRKKFEFQYIKNDKVRVRARCSAKGCKWLILCSWCSARNMFVVKNYTKEHSCIIGTTKNKRVTAHVVAKNFGELIGAMPSIRPRQLKAMVRKELGVFITTKVCRNAKILVIKKIEAQFKEDFKVLNNYALELRITNPGSTVIVLAHRSTPDQDPTFQRMYICLSAIKEGFIAGCRKLIGLDGCFLKGLLKGQLLVAVGRDGNNQMFPIAWAVVDKETTDSWMWFIEQLIDDVCIGDGLGWSIVSDMQKGLIHAVKTLLPLVEHRMCARHIYARWGKKHQGKELQMLFWTAARSTSQPEVQKHLEAMKALNGGTVAVEELLEKWPVEGWCQAFFNDVVKCDVIDNNMCETFNGVILDARNKPIITMLEDIRQYVMCRIVVKREYVRKWTAECGPNIIAKIEKERKNCGKWQVEWNGGAIHEVYFDDLMLHVREGYVVKLGGKTCSCGKWDKSGITCQHALAAIAFEGSNPVDHISDWFKKEVYLKAYEHHVNPIKGRMHWPTSEEGPLLAPIVKRMPGRPCKKRKREPLEGKNKAQTKISRHGRVMRCKLCKTQGHNRTGCPQRTSNVSIDEHQGETGSQQNVASSGGHGKKNTKGTAAQAPTRKKSSVHAPSQARDNPSSNYSPMTLLRGAHTGEAIYGRESTQNTSFITVRKLLEIRRKNRAKNRGDTTNQTAETIDLPEFPTQQSTSAQPEAASSP